VRVMGVINCSPESFFSGSFVKTSAIRAKAEAMVEEGAVLIDIGARSTAPDSPPLDEKRESERMASALAELDGSGILVSVDTTHASVLETCLSHDIHAVNDIGGLAHREYAEIVAGSGLPAFLMASHVRPGDAMGFPDTIAALSRVASRCTEHGISEYVLDPGIGRWIPERTPAMDWDLCRHFEEFRRFGRPLLAAISRKSFLGTLVEKGPEGRLPASLALTAVLIGSGADVIRTHDVAPTVDVIKVMEALGGKK